mgnify:CR=1 FL=1
MPLIEDLAAIVALTDMLVGDEVLRRPSQWRSSSSCQAICIVRTLSVAQVSQILQMCPQKHQPVVTHGDGTGLVLFSVATQQRGGSFPGENE